VVVGVDAAWGFEELPEQPATSRLRATSAILVLTGATIGGLRGQVDHFRVRTSGVVRAR
jgi:hypothetical protein